MGWYAFIYLHTKRKMSIYRVITRIIPLHSSESTFEPASFDALTDGHVGEVKVLDLTEPQSGMKYRIERIEYVQNVGPGETIEGANAAYAEKLRNIPGFVQLKTNEVPSNPYDKSFQLTLPKVLLGKTSGESSNANTSQNKTSDSFKISVVKNFNFNSSYKSPKKQATPLSKNESDDFQCDARSPKGFKTKYPSYLSKKIKNSVWGNKNKTSPTGKSSKQLKTFRKVHFNDCHGTNSTPAPQNYDCPTSSYVQANKNIDTRKALDVRITGQLGEKTNNQLSEPKKDGSTRIIDTSTTPNDDDEKTDTSLDLFDLEYDGELIINVPESTDLHPREDNLPENTNHPEPAASLVTPDKSTVNGTLDNSAAAAECRAVASECLASDSSAAPRQNEPEGSIICSKYLVLKGHPLYDLLMSLKKYFVNGECLICGFIPTDAAFNASEHMESHTSSNSFVSCFKCSCCDEKFGSPKNLYMHTLAREKTYRYMCNICLLKFKRKHYLMRHMAKVH